MGREGERGLLHLELLGAEGVSHILQRVTETVGVVVGGVDAPIVPGPGVGSHLDSVGHRVHFTVLHHHLHPQSYLEGEVRGRTRGSDTVNLKLLWKLHSLLSTKL